MSDKRAHLRQHLGLWLRVMAFAINFIDSFFFFRVFEAGWLYDSFPFLYTVLCVFIEHCEIL